MRNPLSDRIVEIKPSGIRKFFDIVSEMDDAISLGVGEPDFDTPWHIRDEGIYSLEKGRTFYTSNTGLKELRQEIAAYLQRTQGVTYDPMKEVIVTVGGSEAIDIALRAMINPGDEVLIPQPSYVSYEPCAILANAKPVIIELKEENEFRLTAQELRDAINDKTKVLILPFPNNPTGAIMEKKDLEEKLLSIARSGVPIAVAHESPHRVIDLVSVICETLPGCRVSASCDLTKLHEKTIRGTAEEVLAMLRANEKAEKGEYCLVLDLHDVRVAEKKTASDASLEARIFEQLMAGRDMREAGDALMEQGEKRNDVYRARTAVQKFLEELLEEDGDE